MKIDIESLLNGEQILFVLSDGSKSPVFKSKEVAFEAANDLYRSNTINEVEFSDLVNKIMNVNTLPFDGGIEKTVVIALCLIGSMAISGNMSIFEKAKKNCFDVFSLPVKVRFEMCECKQLHGRIYHRGGVTNELTRKKSVIVIAECLKNDGMITEEELKDLKLQIWNSPLPD